MKTTQSSEVELSSQTPHTRSSFSLLPPFLTLDPGEFLNNFQIFTNQHTKMQFQLRQHTNVANSSKIIATYTADDLLMPSSSDDLLRPFLAMMNGDYEHRINMSGDHAAPAAEVGVSLLIKGSQFNSSYSRCHSFSFPGGGDYSSSSSSAPSSFSPLITALNNNHLCTLWAHSLSQFVRMATNGSRGGGGDDGENPSSSDGGGGSSHDISPLLARFRAVRDEPPLQGVYITAAAQQQPSQHQWLFTIGIITAAEESVASDVALDWFSGVKNGLIINHSLTATITNTSRSKSEEATDYEADLAAMGCFSKKRGGGADYHNPQQQYQQQQQQQQQCDDDNDQQQQYHESQQQQQQSSVVKKKIDFDDHDDDGDGADYCCNGRGSGGGISSASPSPSPHDDHSSSDTQSPNPSAARSSHSIPRLHMMLMRSSGSGSVVSATSTSVTDATKCATTAIASSSLARSSSSSSAQQQQQAEAAMGRLMLRHPSASISSASTFSSSSASASLPSAIRRGASASVPAAAATAMTMGGTTAVTISERRSPSLAQSILRTTHHYHQYHQPQHQQRGNSCKSAENNHDDNDDDDTDTTTRERQAITCDFPRNQQHVYLQQQQQQFPQQPAVIYSSHVVMAASPSPQRYDGSERQSPSHCVSDERGTPFSSPNHQHHRQHQTQLGGDSCVSMRVHFDDDEDDSHSNALGSTPSAAPTRHHNHHHRCQEEAEAVVTSIPRRNRSATPQKGAVGGGGSSSCVAGGSQHCHGSQGHHDHPRVATKAEIKQQALLISGDGGEACPRRITDYSLLPPLFLRQDEPLPFCAALQPPPSFSSSSSSATKRSQQQHHQTLLLSQQQFDKRQQHPKAAIYAAKEALKLKLFWEPSEERVTANGPMAPIHVFITGGGKQNNGNNAPTANANSLGRVFNAALADEVFQVPLLKIIRPVTSSFVHYSHSSHSAFNANDYSRHQSGMKRNVLSYTIAPRRIGHNPATAATSASAGATHSTAENYTAPMINVNAAAAASSTIVINYGRRGCASALLTAMYAPPPSATTTHANTAVAAVVPPAVPPPSNSRGPSPSGSNGGAWHNPNNTLSHYIADNIGVVEEGEHVISAVVEPSEDYAPFLTCLTASLPAFLVVGA